MISTFFACGACLAAGLASAGFAATDLTAYLIKTGLAYGTGLAGATGAVVTGF